MSSLSFTDEEPAAQSAHLGLTHVAHGGFQNPAPNDFTIGRPRHQYSLASYEKPSKMVSKISFSQQGPVVNTRERLGKWRKRGRMERAERENNNTERGSQRRDGAGTDTLAPHILGSEAGDKSGRSCSHLGATWPPGQMTFSQP